MKIKVKAKNLLLIYCGGVDHMKKIIAEKGEDTIILVDLEEYCQGFKKQLETDILKDDSIMKTTIRISESAIYFVKEE